MKVIITLIALLLFTLMLMIFSLLIGIYLKNIPFLIIGVISLFALVLIILEIKKHPNDLFF
jgi:uncharacterized membrane protein